MNRTFEAKGIVNDLCVQVRKNKRKLEVGRGSWEVGGWRLEVVSGQWSVLDSLYLVLDTLYLKASKELHE